MRKIKCHISVFRLTPSSPYLHRENSAPLFKKRGEENQFAPFRVGVNKLNF